MAELLRIISDLEYFLAQGHGCHSLNTLALSVGFEHCSALSHYVTMLPCCDSLTQFVVCVCVCVWTEESLWVYITLGKHCCHCLPLAATASICQLACHGEACYCCGPCQRAPSSVCRGISRVPQPVSQPALVVLTTSPRSCVTTCCGQANRKPLGLVAMASWLTG